jgi:hypothetical protein
MRREHWEDANDVSGNHGWTTSSGRRILRPPEHDDDPALPIVEQWTTGLLEDDMTLEYRFEPEDWVRWCLHQAQHSAVARRNRRFTVFFSYAVYFAVASFMSAQLHAVWATAVAFLFFVAFCVLTPSYIDRRTEGAFRTQALSACMKGGFGAHRLTVTEEGLIEEAPAVTSHVSWESVCDVVTDKNYLFILLSDGRAAVISRDSYSGPVPFEQIAGDINAYRQLYATQRTPAPNQSKAEPPSNPADRTPHQA